VVFKSAVVLLMLASSAGGGAWAYYSSRGAVISPQHVTASAQKLFRTTARKFDSSIYVRGDGYDLCIGGYGQTALNKTNAELVWNCECFDKSIGSLSSNSRDTAVAAVRGLPGAAASVTPLAARVLKKCDITPVSNSFMTMRGTQ
jgi:hypothetical protein